MGAAQTVWLHIDRSPSMDYRSSLAPIAKSERAIVLGLAAADMLVRGGERVGLFGASPAIASRRIIERLGEAMVASRDFGRELPDAPLAPRSEAVLIADFIAPLELIERRLKAMAGRGGRGHLLVISDPAEETFPTPARPSSSIRRMASGCGSARRDSSPRPIMSAWRRTGRGSGASPTASAGA